MNRTLTGQIFWTRQAVSSIKPDHAGSKMDVGEEVACDERRVSMLLLLQAAGLRTASARFRPPVAKVEFGR
jgi:hypothetical protein